MTQKIELGKYQELIVTKKTDFGVFLNTPTGEDSQKILLPKAQVPAGTDLKDVLKVFVYKDSEDRPIATTLEPDLTLGNVARLYVTQVTPIGAFLEWGLAKDLFPIYARVAQVMEDGRLTLSVKKKIPEQMNEDADFIYRCLEQEGGFLPFHDKSAPEAIKNRFHMSKNAFKRGIGHLMKKGLITITNDGIRKV